MSALLAAALFAAPAIGATDDEEPAQELIHSDLPLFGDAYDRMWPQHFTDGDSFGCNSRVAFGDWQLKGDWPDGMTDGWFRFTNYGVFHCYVIVRQAWERDDLEMAPYKYGFFVELGDTNLAGRKLELWAIQSGTRPGSDYILLSRSPDRASIRSFTVLQRECPKGAVRNAGQIDISFTRYCAINSREDLLRLARKMAGRRPLGAMTLVADETDRPEAPSASSKH